MKEVKTFVIASLIILLLKVIGGVVCHSYTLIASGGYDLVLIIISLFVFKSKENKKYKGIISSLSGFLFILLGLGIIFFSIVYAVKKTSFFILIFLLLTLIVRYVISCFYTNLNYQKQRGLLSFGIINSNVDFYNYGVILGSLVLCKLSKWVTIFKYADRLGTILIALLIIIKGFKVIKNSFKYDSCEELLISDDYKLEITNRSEVKKLDSLKISQYGGIRRIDCGLELNSAISMIDVNAFVVTLQDYLLKCADVACIYLVDKRDIVKKKVKVRSLKQDARNSGSRNGKTNTKKKNSKKKNK